MQTNIQDQYASIRTRVIDALLPNGFKVTNYEATKDDNKVCLKIGILDSSLKPMRKVSLEITDVYDETFSTRTFGITFNGAESVVDVDGHERQSRQIRGAVKHQLTASERCKYSTAQFLVSKQGLEYLNTVRQDIQRYCAKLDLHAQAKQLLDSVQRILKADKEQHRTLLAADTREQLTLWIAKHRKLAEDKLDAWIKQGQRLQKKPLAELSMQAEASALKASNAKAPGASDEQLHALAARFAPWHKRAF